MQSTTKRSSTTTVGVRASSKVSGVPANIHAAAQLIYFALLDPSCKEVHQALDDLRVLDHKNKTFHLDVFHRQIVEHIPIHTWIKGGKKGRRTKGGMSMQKCILLGMLVVLLTVASYIVTIRSETSTYHAKCANVMRLFDPKRDSVSTFFTELNKFAHMVFNKEHIEYCKNLEDKYGNLGIYFARELNKTMGTLRARLTASFAIVTAIMSIMNGGVHALICIAARWMNELDSMCGESCTATAKKSSPKSTKKESPKKEEDEEEEEQDEEEED